MRFIYNEGIRAPRLVVIDEVGNNLGEISREEALAMAREKELDLILVSAKDNNNVAKIGDLSKMKYEKAKKLKNNKSGNTETKEWWFKPNIQERDLQIKIEKVKKFITKGGSAKLTVRYASKVSPQTMNDAMQKIIAAITEFGRPISEVLREGRNLSITIKSVK